MPAHVASGKTGDGTQKVLLEWNGGGEARGGKANGKGAGMCLSQGSTRDTEPARDIH